MKIIMGVGVLVAVCCAQVARASPLNEGTAYAIADNWVDHEETPGAPGEGSHYHASNVLPVDPVDSTVIASDVAEAGGFFGAEEIRGLIQFDVRGNVLAESVTLGFEVADVLQMGLNDNPVGGLYGQEKYVGTIDAVAYIGDNVESLDDFQAASIGTLGSFPTDSLNAGDLIELDVTRVYNEQINAGRDALGVRLQISQTDTVPDTAISFDNFRLTVVPEPSTWGLVSLALLLLLGAGRRNPRRVAT